MEINIWSDVRCPFCYIGKHKFEKALEAFPHKDKITVNWRSFELDPNLKTNPGLNSAEYLAAAKGISLEQVKEMNGHVLESAKEVGLTFNFEDSVPANSFNAHRLIQFAKSKGLGNEIEEALFEAHFKNGVNIDDTAELIRVGKNIGLDEKEVTEVLESDAFTNEVRADQKQAQAYGIQGVPFFVLNNKYGVSGAQPVEAFAQALEKSWSEYEEDNKIVIMNNGASCSVDGECD